MKPWIEPSETILPDGFLSAIGGHPLVAQVLLRRGLDSPEAARAFLDPQHYSPASPYELPDMQKAVGRLWQAIRQGELIAVWGDFDVDGQTATTLLVSTVQALGGKVVFHIPIRERESHGINLPRLEALLQRGVSLLLTCDTGISAHEAIAFAQSQGVEVIVTDHHDLPETLPSAFALLNPKLLPGDHPLATLPGVGVAYKLAEALFERADRAEQVQSHLDLVALGIVADVAMLTGDTRYLLQRGIQALRHTHRLGLLSLMETAELNPEHLSEQHIAYILAPRLNALGRLADANLAVELLTTEDLGRARLLAAELEGLNAQRKWLSDQILRACQAQIEREPSLLGEPVLVFSHPAWSAGVIGIVAGRLVERYHRPVVLIAAPPGEMARGSARSIEGCNITQAIATHARLLSSYGGHPMAAGFSLPPENIPEFRRLLSRTVGEMLRNAQVEPSLSIEAILPLAELSPQLVEDLERLAPFGPGNPSPVLACPNLRLHRYTPLGRTQEHLQLTVEDESGARYKVIWWDSTPEDLPETIREGGPFDLAYLARASNFRGQAEIEIEWVDCRLTEEASILLQRAPIEVIDYRQMEDPLSALRQLSHAEEVQVWCEAEARPGLAQQGIAVSHRDELRQADSLVIWTSPPGHEALQQALARVSPRRVYLFGVDPESGGVEAFLKRLAGLIKHALKSNQGWVRLSILAAETAQEEITVRAGIAWLEAHGDLTVRSEEGDSLWLERGGQREEIALNRATTRLKALLDESTAYRIYFRNADAETLINPPV